MHPIERLRYVARSQGGDQRVLVDETATALRGLGLDPAGVVVACRRIIERHPTSGPLWWLCSSVLTAPDPLRAARGLADEVIDDPTADHLVTAISDDATVCLIGWPDLIGEAMIRRGDVTVLAVDIDDEGSAFVRRLQRADVEAEIVPAAGMGAAALASDAVMIEALAAGHDGLLATLGSRPLAAAAYCAEVPVWAVLGRGRCLPDQLYASMLARLGDRHDTWYANAEHLPLALATTVVSPYGVVAAAEHALTPECALAGELLRSSAM